MNYSGPFDPKLFSIWNTLLIFEALYWWLGNLKQIWLKNRLFHFIHKRHFSPFLSCSVMIVLFKTFLHLVSKMFPPMSPLNICGSPVTVISKTPFFRHWLLKKKNLSLALSNQKQFWHWFHWKKVISVDDPPVYCCKILILRIKISK